MAPSLAQLTCSHALVVVLVVGVARRPGLARRAPRVADAAALAPLGHGARRRRARRRRRRRRPSRRHQRRRRVRVRVGAAAVARKHLRPGHRVVVEVGVDLFVV